MQPIRLDIQTPPVGDPFASVPFSNVLAWFEYFFGSNLIVGFIGIMLGLVVVFAILGFIVRIALR